MPAIVVCSTCETKLKVPDGSAAKALRCPKCKGVVPIAQPPKPPPPVVEEEFEVNEAVDEQEEKFEVNEAVDDHEGEEDERDEDSPLAQLGFDKVKNVFKKGQIPDEVRDAMERTFVKNERAMWAGRPNRALCESRAWIGLVVGPICILVGVAILVGLMFFPADNALIKLLILAVGAIFCLAFGAVGVLAIIFRKRIGGNPNDCYVVTNERAYIFDANGKGVRAFTAKQLEAMTCQVSTKFADAGDLIFVYDLHGQDGVFIDQAGQQKHGGTPVGFLNIDNVQQVRRMLDEVLIEPKLDKAKKKRKKDKKRRFI